jgi:hypothetical protein
LHEQLPLWQTRLFVHAWPHEPQLLLSLCSATQAPLQLVYVLLHAKEHAPPEQVGDACATPVVQAVAEPQAPPAPQLSTLVPEHVVWPGAQTPEQIPLAHVVLTQAEAPLQVPLDWQVSTPLPEHVVCPGPHTPLHAPATHAWLLHAAVFCQVPVALHD